MRILAITNLYPPYVHGGYEMECQRTAEAMRERGHDVTVLTSALPDGYADGPDADVRRVLDLPPVYEAEAMAAADEDQRLAWLRAASWVAPGNLRAVAEVLAAEDPDVVHLWNLYGLGGLGLLTLLDRAGRPWVWQLGDQIPRLLCGLDGQYVPALGAAFGGLVRGRYVVVSATLLGEITVDGLELSGNVHIVPVGTEGKAGAPRPTLRRDGPLRVAHAAAFFGEHKGTDLVLRAAALVEQRLPGVARFSFYGEDRAGRFAAMAEDLGVAEAVRFHGVQTQEQLRVHYLEQDIFTFPTAEREPFGSAAFEAMGAGCVPLMTEMFGGGEWLVDGVHCLKAARTAEAFADRIADAVRGDVDLAAMGRRGQRLVDEETRMDVVVPRVERILRDAAADPAVRLRAVAGAADGPVAQAAGAAAAVHELIDRVAA